MGKGLWDDIPINNPARDKAWEAFIKRKDVKAHMKDVDDFKFPLGRGFYDLWCLAWHRAWDAGFFDGYEAGIKAEKEKNS